MNKIIEIIVEWIGDNYPLVFAFIAVIWITWKVSRLYAKQKSINEKVDDLPCTKHREDIDTSHSNYNELLRVTNEVNVTVSGMEDRLIEVLKWIIKKDSKMTDALMAKASPLNITPLGYVVYNESGAAKLMEEHLPAFIDTLAGIDPKTAYDVENESFNIILKNTGQPYFKPLKDYLYVAPDPAKFVNPDTKKEVDISLSLSQIAKLMSLVLRDEYLKLHPEIDPMEEKS
ncbi:MAG: hypothetical protein BGO33_13790 [Bacteroidia bacterium 43-41]|nr:MAG: hypothetical protein BGO33_13790 [Bacteroidia bacterium 43-41]